MITYGSLCTGVGGLDLAVEKMFGASPAWFAETDKDASKVLAVHWPGVPNLGDLTVVDWSAVEPVDILCAGPPCQPVSVAGKRKGPNDERFLWADILGAVERLRPGRLVFENPPGIAPWLPAIVRRLADLGYVGRYGRLRASSVGCCHRRERVFIVASDADGERPQGRGSSEPHGSTEPADDGEGSPADAQRVALREQSEPVAGGSGTAVDRRSSEGSPTDVSQLRSVRCGPARGRGDGSADDRRFPWGRYRPAIERAERIFGPAPWPVVEGTRSLSGDFTAWMMGMEPGWLDGVSNTAKKRLSGNAVVTRQAIGALRELADTESSDPRVVK